MKRFVICLAILLAAGVSSMAQDGGKKESLVGEFFVEASAGAKAAWGYEKVLWGGAMHGRGLSPNCSVRAGMFFVNESGYSDWGIGIAYSGPYGKFRGNSFHCSHVSADFIWKAAQTFSKGAWEKFEVNPVVSVGCIFSGYGTGVTMGLGGQLGLNIVDNIGLFGELMGNCYDLKVLCGNAYKGWTSELAARVGMRVIF